MHMQKSTGSYVIPISGMRPDAHAYRRDGYFDSDIFGLEDGLVPQVTVHRGLDAPFSVTATSSPDDFVYKRSLPNIRRDRADYYILFVVLSGSIRLLYNGHRSSIARGDIFFARANVPYEMVVHPGTDDPYCQICVSLPADAVDQLDLAGLAGIPITPADGDGQLIQELTRALFRHGMTITAPVARALLDTILLDVSRIAQGGARTELRKASLRDIRRDAIMAYLDSHCTNPDLRASMVAAACQMSVRYMSRLLAEQHSSFSAVVRARRLQRLQSWLVDPTLADVTIAALAYRAGFSSASHCTALFRKEFGCSPSRFRRQRLSDIGSAHARASGRKYSEGS